MGLLDRFKGKNSRSDSDIESEQKGQADPGAEQNDEASGADRPSDPPAQKDMTDLWLQPQKPPVSDPAPPRADQFTGAAGTFSRLTASEPVDTGDPAAAKPQPKPEPAPARQVEPVSEEEIDRLLEQAMKGHSSRDVEALWEAILSKPELHLLQRGKGEKTEAHAVESPLGPMLLLFTATFRIQALIATKAYRNSPFVWRAVTMPTEDALQWVMQQHARGIQAIEVNRSEQPGIASVLQAMPSRYEKVYGRRPKGADLVDPDFEAMANRARISASPEHHTELISAFCSMQRWYALRDPNRPNQPGFTQIEDKPALMLFTSEAEARAAAEASGRARELPKVIMPLQPEKVAGWMATLPDKGAEQAVVNLTSTAFVLDLRSIAQRIAGASA